MKRYPYTMQWDKEKKEYKRAHRLLAEKVLGRSLPHRVKIHHVNEIPWDNRPENLVICPNQSYHMLLHYRADALKATGNPNSKKCYICQEYDNEKNLNVAWKTTHKVGQYWHTHCRSARRRVMYAARRKHD